MQKNAEMQKCKIKTSLQAKFRPSNRRQSYKQFWNKFTTFKKARIVKLVEPVIGNLPDHRVAHQDEDPK
jgi:hypothetical protein